MKTGFIPIKFDDYVARHLKNNPGTPRKEITDALKDALQAYRRGKKCACGEPLWVIGSAVAGHACFTCITLEATPDNDFEIDEACES